MIALKPCNFRRRQTAKNPRRGGVHGVLRTLASRVCAYRLLVIPDDADADAARTEYRERTGYCRLLTVLSETDARL